jgi:hypothetical protein
MIYFLYLELMGAQQQTRVSAEHLLCQLNPLCLFSLGKIFHVFVFSGFSFALW